MKKSQKDLENEREKSRIIHEFIAKTHLPLYSSNPSRVVGTTRNEKVRSWFMETSERPQYYNPKVFAPKTIGETLTATKISDNICRSRSDQLNYNLPFKPKTSTSYQLQSNDKQRYEMTTVNGSLSKCRTQWSSPAYLQGQQKHFPFHFLLHSHRRSAMGVPQQKPKHSCHFLPKLPSW